MVIATAISVITMVNVNRVSIVVYPAGILSGSVKSVSKLKIIIKFIPKLNF